MMRAKEKRRNCIWAVGQGRDASQSRGTEGLIRGADADRAAEEARRGESPLARGPHWSVQRGQHLRLKLLRWCGKPRRGAPSRASEASRLASTWAEEKFAQTHRELLAAPDSGGRYGFEVRRWSSGLATPGGAPAAAASGMLRAHR